MIGISKSKKWTFAHAVTVKGRMGKYPELNQLCIKCRQSAYLSHSENKPDHHDNQHKL